MADAQSQAPKGQKDSATNSSLLTAPQISLPKGGGAIRGIGEKFSANPVTGTASLSVPIYTSPGRSGFGPQLSLSYDSGSGNGPFGFGWSLALPSITRKTDKGLPQYADAEESDTFILSGAEDLVPLLVESNGQWTRDVSSRSLYSNRYEIHRYRPRVEGLFARIERWENQDDAQDTFWRSISKDNVTTWYGKTAECRIADPADAARVFTWLMCESYDDKGNVILYKYKRENTDGVDLSSSHERNRTDATRSANRYLKRIFYANRTPYYPDLTASQPIPLPSDWCFELVFDYGEHDHNLPLPSESAEAWICRKDPFSTDRPTFELRTYRLCCRALMFHHFAGEDGVGLNCLVRSTNFAHAQVGQGTLHPSKPFYSYLLSVTQTGYRRDGQGRYLSKSLPPLEFSYSDAVIDETVHEVDTDSLENLPAGLEGSQYRWVDLDGEGLSGILTEQAGNWYYKPNWSPVNVRAENGEQTTLARFGPMQAVMHRPSLAALSGGRQQLLSLSGDGQLDLAQLGGPVPGYFERTDDGTWAPFKPFTSLPTLDWGSPNLKFVDVNGDGLADVLLSEDDAFRWHLSLGAEGFGPSQRVAQADDEEKGPKLIFADSTETIFLADMTGDGLTDLVRIRNGEICYWPNLGYGHFGAKVTMDQAPIFESPDLFDARRIRLADIDGSATSDMAYFGSTGVHLYFNQSGNAWGTVRVLDHFPPIDTASSATVLDLLGNGTACLVWSSPLPGNAQHSMRYIDLMGGQKPHLLVQVSNNLGAETRVQYAPSTKFYVADKLAGNPWLTRIPFPVHVVERVETYDWISRNRFVTRYAYHHGDYDGIDREFRGFGKVEQWDNEEFATLSDSSNFPQATNIDAASSVPPVLTTTWFHTGAYFGEARVLKHFEHEYYHEGDAREGNAGLSEAQRAAMRLDDAILPVAILLSDGTRVPYSLSGDEAREACRALRGSILRQEIYGLDDTEASDRPYSASERNYTIEMLQPQGPNRHAVFFTHPRETIDFHYERKLFKVVGNSLADPNQAPRDARDAADPRVTHAFTLDVDTFGNVLQSVAVGYGRRYLDPTLTPADQNKQGTLLSTYTENGYTNAVLADDAHRAPLAAAASTYELIQFQPDAAHTDVTNLFRFDEVQTKLRAAGDGLHDIPYENLNATGVQAGQPHRRLIERMRTLYRPDDMGAAAGDSRTMLPPGKVERLALPGISYKLAFTPGLLSVVYQRGQTPLLSNPAAVVGTLGASGGGYVDLVGDGHWWIPSGRMYYFPAAASPLQEKAQALQHFFLPRRFEDAFGNSTTVGYDDPHNLLVVRTVDAVANTVSVANDYRVLQPERMTDPNGNRAAVSFDVLGMVAGTAVMGKTTEKLGDSLDGFTPDLTQTQIDGFQCADDPHTLAGALLGTATTRIIYDVDRFFISRTTTPNDPSKWEPVVAATVGRETHVSDLEASQQSRLQISFSYSDGFGREIQKKIQAETGPVVDGGPVVNPRWVCSGWTIFNNKGKPVRKYEPFFSQLPAKGHQFKFGVQFGVSPILCYDPVERVIATVHPNHTYEKVVFDPWRQETWDVNDTVLQADPKADPDVGDFFHRLPDHDYLPVWYTQRAGGGLGPQEQDAATKTAVHANTPTVGYFDTLGRTILTIAYNAAAGKYSTRVELDIEGHQRSVTDALERRVMVYDYDVLGTRIHQLSADAGERWMLNDVLGKTLRSWDSRDHQIRHEYDAARRPTNLFVQTGSSPGQIAEKTIYGEGQPNTSQDQALNLRGKVYQQFDGAGVVTNNQIDFKGNLVSSSRQLLHAYKNPVDWSKSPPLTGEVFTSSSTFDALNRPVTLEAPDASVIRLTYNATSLLAQIAVGLRGAAAATPFVSNIDYNAKGQRNQIVYGNGAQTVYTYDPNTFRLVTLTTTRASDNATVQALSYSYDPVGNVTRIVDRAQQTIYFNDQVVDPSTDYTYDAIYRLTQASGRELIGLATQPQTIWNDAPRMGQALPMDGQAMRNYTEAYQYDAVGNILSLTHAATNGSWTRNYVYDEPNSTPTNNRLTSTTVSGTKEQPFLYDAHGSMTQMPHLSLMAWNFKDQLQATQQRVASGPVEATYYIYDAAGQRVRKITETARGVKANERVYLGGFEVYRAYDSSGSTTLERQTLNVMDNKQRIAVVETRTLGTAGSPTQVVRFQCSNHLGSTILELDNAAQVISYEEYYPFGGTSYQLGRNDAEMGVKRYRYTGKERDEATGLYYHGARYYAPWLGRWTACDPVGPVDGLNLYQFARSNPVVLVDPDGKQSGPWAQYELMKRVQQWTSEKVAPIEKKMDQFDAKVGEVASEAQEAVKNWGKQILTGTVGASFVYGSGNQQVIAAHDERMHKQDIDLIATTLEKATMTSPANAPGPQDKPLDRPSVVGQAVDFALTVGPLVAGSPAGGATSELSAEVGAARLELNETAATRSVGAASLDDPALAGNTPSYGDTQASLKSIRRHTERLVSGKVVSSDAAVRSQTAQVQSAISTGNRAFAGQEMHELHFEFSRELEGSELQVNRRLATPGQNSEYRVPDFHLVDPNYIPARPTAAWDLKLSGLNEYSHHLSNQFTDIREATGIRPVPLYYRLPGMN